jgi:hypothetical protein
MPPKSRLIQESTSATTVDAHTQNNSIPTFPDEGTREYQEILRAFYPPGYGQQESLLVKASNDGEDGKQLSTDEIKAIWTWRHKIRNGEPSWLVCAYPERTESVVHEGDAIECLETVNESFFAALRKNGLLDEQTIPSKRKGTESNEPTKAQKDNLTKSPTRNKAIPEQPWFLGDGAAAITMDRDPDTLGAFLIADVSRRDDTSPPKSPFKTLPKSKSAVSQAIKPVQASITLGKPTTPPSSKDEPVKARMKKASGKRKVTSPAQTKIVKKKRKISTSPESWSESAPESKSASDFEEEEKPLVKKTGRARRGRGRAGKTSPMTREALAVSAAQDSQSAIPLGNPTGIIVTTTPRGGLRGKRGKARVVSDSANRATSPRTSPRASATYKPSPFGAPPDLSLPDSPASQSSTKSAQPKEAQKSKKSSPQKEAASPKPSPKASQNNQSSPKNQSPKDNVAPSKPSVEPPEIEQESEKTVSPNSHRLIQVVSNQNKGEGRNVIKISQSSQKLVSPSKPLEQPSPSNPLENPLKPVAEPVQPSPPESLPATPRKPVDPVANDSPPLTNKDSPTDNVITPNLKSSSASPPGIAFSHVTPQKDKSRQSFYIASSPLESPHKLSSQGMSSQMIQENLKNIENMISDDVNLVEERRGPEQDLEQISRTKFSLDDLETVSDYE